MNLIHDQNATPSNDVVQAIEEFLEQVPTLETTRDMPIVIFQDGVNGAYYIKCSLLADDATSLCDLEAKLDLTNPESFKANRKLLLKHKTYKKMAEDASAGREFNDIIVEYNTDYDPQTPLKVWGGQHRISAIREAGTDSNRYHGFRIYFNLTKKQRTEVALISNTNIAVSNDTFDRMVEETVFGDKLRKWCRQVGLLDKQWFEEIELSDIDEDFPDAGARSEKITVKRARSFIVNFYLGRERGEHISSEELDHNVYDPYLATTGVTIDPRYTELMKQYDILSDTDLTRAGERFAALYKAQYRAVIENPKINRKWYRNKALVESVICGWSYIAGLLQSHPGRLENHYRIPRVTGLVPDPLNAEAMSKFKHDRDKPTYRGLGTRSSTKDRRRIAQLFLAKSLKDNVAIDENFMRKAVSQVVGLLSLAEGYA